jgi:hypothetical protein
LVGSGNATVGGLIRNAEVFGLFDFDGGKSQGPHPAFPDLFEFFEELGQNASETVRRQLTSARQMAPWLAASPVRDGRTILIGGPGKRGLLRQILEHLPTKKADSLITLSSSFDRNLGGLKELASKSKTKPICIVQHENAEIDGQVVQKTHGSFEWRPFLDPYPREKRQRKDARAHAKILVFGHSTTETCVFGSANASSPALESKNTEVVVVLSTSRRGYVCRRLGLEASLKAKSIHKELSENQWATNQDLRPESKFSCLLSAVAATEGGYRLSFASGSPTKVSRLVLSDRSHGRPKGTASIQRDGDSFIAPLPEADEHIRFALIATEQGKPLSNAVGITWPRVAAPRKLCGSGAKVGPALISMQEGAVLGTVLFELLDQFREFEVIKIRAGQGTGTKTRTFEKKPAKEQSADFFYTDAKADEISGHHWTGDRIDLDILASLVQPLTPLGTPEKGDDDEYDDSNLAEEAERRRSRPREAKE